MSDSNVANVSRLGMRGSMREPLNVMPLCNLADEDATI
jgi:hypothetical protein